MEARRRVLVLAYFFPPLGGAGVQRTLKFVRYLEPLGWDATVITTRSRSYGAQDESLLEEIPAGTRVVRARELPLARWIGLAAQRFRLTWLRDWALWPDGGRGWAPFALVAALREVRRQRPDVIFSTSAPYGTHLAAMCLSRRTGIPWVADFRDEWASNRGLAHQPAPLARLAAKAERSIGTAASRVVVAADYFRLEGLRPDNPRRQVIWNGVDLHDPPKQSAGPPLDRFVLAHVGTVYDAVDPSPVLAALSELTERGLIDRARIQVRFVGSIWRDNFRPPPGIRFERIGYVEHARAVAEMRSATALLLFVPSSSLAPSGKVFEYLASGRPVLCVTHPENLAARLVREWSAGVTAHPDEPGEIETALLTLWHRWQAGGLPDRDEVFRWTLERYSRQGAAAQLAHVLDQATHG